MKHREAGGRFETRSAADTREREKERDVSRVFKVPARLPAIYYRRRDRRGRVKSREIPLSAHLPSAIIDRAADRLA